MRKFAFFLALVFFASLLSAQPKRPMTFEDMMHMKRLGSTAVSPDGKWLAYSVTSVNLDQNTKTAGLLIQPIAGGDAKPLTVAQPKRQRNSVRTRRALRAFPFWPGERAADMAGRLR